MSIGELLEVRKIKWTVGRRAEYAKDRVGSSDGVMRGIQWGVECSLVSKERRAVAG